MFPGFTILGKFISSYSLCAIAGIFTACPLSIHWYKKRGGNDIALILVYLFGAVGAFLGMHILYGITNIPLWYFLAESEGIKDFILKFAQIFGGSVFYGGLLGGLLAGGISVRVQKLPAGLTTDCAAPALALFHCFGRIGCFMGGCCYGVESEHGITFTRSLIESANGVPRVPVQLYEAAFELALFFALWLLLNKGILKNRLLLVYIITYSVGRFILEFWRGDEYRGFLFGLSTSQIISILVFVVSAVIFVIKPKKRAESVEES
ncbi:MAG: prolipoprotein diacylglyceryl transferase [Oscillospiraceae bacterium]|nr:prolipoprotein diacylglyceryl transferase [Oscillospiraceae bacterium]